MSAGLKGFAPVVFQCEVRDAEKLAPIDSARVNVFGYSMGAYLAYDAATFDSEFFAAVVVTSMGIDQDYFGILAEAKRKIPQAIYMGILCCTRIPPTWNTAEDLYNRIGRRRLTANRGDAPRASQRVFLPWRLLNSRCDS